MSSGEGMNQEGNLRDYFQVFWKHRKTISLIVLIATGLTAAILLLGPKLYKLEKVLRVGQIAEPANTEFLSFQKRMIEEPRTVMERLVSVYEYKSVETRMSSPYVLIVLHSFNKEKIKEKETLLEKHCLDKHSAIFSTFLEENQKKIENLDAYLAQLEGEVNKLESLAASDSGNKGEIRKLLYERRDRLWQARQERNEYLKLKQDPDIYPTQFANQKNEIEPDIRWPIAIIAMVFGLSLLLAIVVVLIRESRV